MKRCNKCKRMKSLSEFYKNRFTKDGLSYYCKKCQMIYSRKYRKTHRKKIAERDRQYLLCHKRETAETRLKYRITHINEIRRSDSKRRNLGCNLLNKWFEGSIGHHINDTDVVFIPKEIHIKTITKAHRKTILEYYGSIERMKENNPI